MAIVATPPRLLRVVDTDAHEGPVYAVDEDALYFTTARAPETDRVDVMRLALDGIRFPLERDRLSVVRRDANAANGMALDREGRLVICEQGTRTRAAAITRMDRAGRHVETLVDDWRGRRLNSPNDVVVKPTRPSGFTDPSYGHLQGFRPEPVLPDAVYRYDPRTDELSVVADTFAKPNGLAFSPGEDVFYVGDSEACRVTAFDVVDGWRLAGERLFSEIAPGYPDGIKVDAAGRVYVSFAGGVRVFAPGGDATGEISLPGAVNFCFGGPGGDVLFVTADDAIWAVVLATTP